MTVAHVRSTLAAALVLALLCACAGAPEGDDAGTATQEEAMATTPADEPMPQDPPAEDPAPAPEGTAATPDPGASAGEEATMVPPDERSQCDADAGAAAVGQAASADVVEQARSAAGAKTARVLSPGQIVTMEYLAGRLNVHVDDANVVTELTCG
jgi:hypothetical protein